MYPVECVYIITMSILANSICSIIIVSNLHCGWIWFWSVEPKFHSTDFHRNFPAGKIMDTNHEICRHKRWQIMKPWSFGESHWHKSQISRTKTISTCQDVCDKVRDKSATNPFVSLWWNLARYNARWKSATKSGTSSRQSRELVADTNHKSRRRDLCRGLSWFVSVTLSRTCPGLCRKVCVM